jgi:hypothetical protein
MRLSATGFTLPWQLVAAHEPGPIYFCGSPLDFADCAATNMSARIAPLAASALRKQSLAKEFIKKSDKESSRLYRPMAGEVNARALPFSNSALKSQRGSIYTLPRGD